MKLLKGKTPQAIEGLEISGFLRVSKGIIKDVSLEDSEIVCFRVAGKSKSMGEGDYAIVDVKRREVFENGLFAVLFDGCVSVIVRCVECSKKRIVLVRESSGQPTFLAKKDFKSLRDSMVIGEVVKILPKLPL